MYIIWCELKEDKAKQASAAAMNSCLEDKKLAKDGVVYQQVEHCELPNQPAVELSLPPLKLDKSSLRHEASGSLISVSKPRN